MCVHVCEHTHTLTCLCLWCFCLCSAESKLCPLSYACNQGLVCESMKTCHNYFKLLTHKERFKPLPHCSDLNSVVFFFLKEYPTLDPKKICITAHQMSWSALKCLRQHSTSDTFASSQYDGTIKTINSLLSISIFGSEFRTEDAGCRCSRQWALSSVSA